MTTKPLHSGLRALFAFGPLAAFLVTYLILRNDTFLIAGREYSGFVAVTAAFVPVFVIASGVLWYMTGTVARIQVAIGLMFVVFAGLGVWLNDARLIKMKPTAVYLILGLILVIGLLRGQSWLKYIMEDMIPLKKKGWMILTRRLTVVFFVSAAANELVWRTQSEEFWVLFETLIMPIVIVGFFLLQIRLFVDYATFGQAKPKR